MRKNILIVVALAFGLLFSPTEAADLTEIEVYDIQKEQVVGTVANSEKIQKEIKRCLEEIAGISKSLNPIPKEGIIVKIPIEPSVTVENEWIYALIDEVKVILPKNEPPLLMVFDDENRPYFFEFNGHPKSLLNELSQGQSSLDNPLKKGK